MIKQRYSCVAAISVVLTLAWYSNARPTKSIIAAREQRIINEVERANSEWFNAIASKDMNTLKRRIADEAVLSSPGGAEADSKASFLSLIQKSNFKSLNLEDWVIKPQKQTVVVIAQAFLEDKGKPIEVGYMNVFIKRHSRWQLLTSYMAETSPALEPKKE